MTFAQLGTFGLVAYLVVLAVVAEVARRARRDRSAADHFLAGRGLGTFVLFLTLYATAYSGNSLLGYPGEAYRRGFSWIMATGFMLSIIVLFQALVPRLRPIAVSHGFVTPGDWVRHRFGEDPGGRALRMTVAVVMVLALANFLLAQLIAMGHVTAQITGGAVSYGFGVVGLAAMILVYETVGGMRAVAWTDTVQGLLMLFGLATLFFWLLAESGGLAAMTAAIAAARPSAVAVPDARECANWISSIILMGVASVIYPQAIQRIFAARSSTTLKRSLALMSFMPLATTTVVTFVGLAAIPVIEDLGLVQADTVMPRLLERWAATGPAATGLAVIVFLGALGAIMSTADSVLLSLGSLLARDVPAQVGMDQAGAHRGKRAAIAVMVLMVGFALAGRVTLWRLIELKMEVLIQCAPVFLLAIHWKALRARPALAGLVAGTVFAVICVFAGVKRMGGVHVGVIGLAVNLAVLFVGTRLSSRAAEGA